MKRCVQDAFSGQKQSELFTDDFGIRDTKI